MSKLCPSCKREIQSGEQFCEELAGGLKKKRRRKLFRSNIFSEESKMMDSAFSRVKLS